MLSNSSGLLSIYSKLEHELHKLNIILHATETITACAVILSFKQNFDKKWLVWSCLLNKL